MNVRVLTEKKRAAETGGPRIHLIVKSAYFAAGFSNIFGSTVGLISSVVSLPLPLG